MITQLDSSLVFPDPRTAPQDENGLIAVGGDLSQARLIEAYRNGIFPWYCEDEPILWWSPDPRCVFNLTDENPIHLSKSLVRNLKKDNYHVVINQNFERVIASCSMPRAKQAETWILPEMQHAYTLLHESGLAHSVEVYNEDNELVGGLYGISFGKFFFGESMFSRQADASKIALAHLIHYLKSEGFILIDCQVPNDHLFSLGAVNISRDNFLDLLAKYRDWHQESDLFTLNNTLMAWK